MLEFDYDEQGRIDGYLVGKQARLADWYAKKEQERYEVIFNRLRALAWQRAVYVEGGERLERLRERKRAYAAKAEVKLRANKLARLRRRARYYANPRIVSCEECGAVWCLLFCKGMPPRFCGANCRNWAAYRRRSQRPKRRCLGCGEMGHNRKTCRHS